MTEELHLQELNLHPGVRVRVKGYIQDNAKTFRINLGKDELNIGMHFNPRFNYHDDHNIIVYNSKTEGNWNEELRENVFPFEDIRTVEVNFDFDMKHFTVRFHNGHEFSLPNRLGLQKIDFISIDGDFQVRGVEFE